MRRSLIGCTSVLIATMVIGGLSIAVFWSLINRVDRQDYGDVAWAFADALRVNDNEKAKSLTTRSKWERIDSWVADHQTFNCPFSLDPDKWATGDGGGSVPAEKDFNTTYFVYFQCNSAPYKFKIDEIVLERSSDPTFRTCFRGFE